MKLIHESPPYLAYADPEGNLVLKITKEGKATFHEQRAIAAIVAVLRHRFAAYNWQDSFLGKTRGKWEQITPPLADSFMHQWVTFASAESFDPGGKPANTVLDASFSERIESLGALVSDTIKTPLASRLLGELHSLPDLNGFLKHPIHGNPPGNWVRPPAPKLRDFPHPAGCSHLRALFSSLNLAPPDHCALYTFLLWCYHAYSLEEPRPILMIDSPVAQIGKSEVSAAISILLDVKPSTVPEFTGSRARNTDSIIAHLTQGRRTLVLSNIDAKEEWNDPFVVCLSTDTGTSQRAKYDRGTTSFPGIVVIMSTVYGTSSFHADVISRVFRTYLPGPPRALAVRPEPYAKEFRNEIIAEILSAHAAAAPWQLVPFTRFNAFEAAGLSAYCAAFGCTPQEASDRLRTAVVGARGLLAEAVPNLHREHSEAFLAINRDVVAQRSGRTVANLEGARALGFTFTDGEWK